jgi:hypothetical protein
MVFWTTYPISNIIQTKFNNKSFKSQIFDRKLVKSPTGIEGIVIRSNQNTKYLKDVRQFLINNFGSPPTTPILDIPEKQLLGTKDNIIILKDVDTNIVGCIRYHYLGIFISDINNTNNINNEIYCVDCFCVNNKWRRKGVGDYLLTTLHKYVNANNIPYSMFLKEGRNLSIIHSPLYTGIYVYRKLDGCDTIYITQTVNTIKSLSVPEAYKLMDLFRELNTDLFIVRNMDSTNQMWRLYNNNTYKVLACFQDAYQRFEEDGEMKKIAWCTGWIESPNMTDEYREEASRELSDTMYPDFDYVWMNKEWCGNNTNNDWKIDGPFNWYTYQWTTSINIKKSYCILN